MRLIDADALAEKKFQERECNGLGEGPAYRQGWNDAIDAVMDNEPSAQPEQRWIPCSERLPEHGGRYLISVLDGINRRTTVAPYLPRCKAWAMNGRMAYWKVIAWLPLPEPYREEDGEEHDSY